MHTDIQVREKLGVRHLSITPGTVGIKGLAPGPSRDVINLPVTGFEPVNLLGPNPHTHTRATFSDVKHQ